MKLRYRVNKFQAFFLHENYASVAINSQAIPDKAMVTHKTVN